MISSSKYFKIDQVPKDTYKAFTNPDFNLISITPNEKPQTPIEKKLISAVRPMMRTEYLRVIDDVYEFKVRSDDVFLITFPKSGTTWAQEMLWLIVNDFDFETAKKVNLRIRSPFLEANGMLTVRESFNILEILESMKTQRLIKTHLMSTLLPKSIWEIQPKTVFVIRNLKDVVVSYYYFSHRSGSSPTNLNDFVDVFVRDTMLYAPYWETILNFWNLRHEKNVLLISYEDMHKDLPAVIRKCCEFLNKPYNEEVVAELAEHLSFANMKANPAVNGETLLLNTDERKDIKLSYKFMRKGAVGSYKEELSEDSIAKLNQWAKDKIAKYDSDFDLKLV